MSPGNPKDLEDEFLREVSASTVGHYDSNAFSFREGTWDHDVSQNREALLAAIGDRENPRVLDFGCGPGRDIVAFQKLGIEVTGLDGSEAFCHMAREVSGAEVLHQDFLALDLPETAFDGIFANATLFHIPSAEMGRVLQEFKRALRPGGILFSSNPRGNDEEGWNGERYGSYYRPETWKKRLEGAGFEMVREYYRPQGLPREEQPWFASVWRKRD